MGSEDIALVAIGFILALMYMTFGIGTARAVSKMKGEEIRIAYVFLWPVVLGVIAAEGDVG